MKQPLAVDLFCGLFGWSEGLIAENYEVVGFDLEDMCGQFGLARPDRVHLVLQDVRSLHGSQLRDAALIVASPPCQRYSHMAMPWSIAKAKAHAIRADETGHMLADLNELFDACFRIQREACEAAGRHIPMVIENVRGAQPWVGRARWNYGSFYFWGDVPALMPVGASRKGVGPSGPQHGMTRWTNPAEGFKSAGLNWSDPSKRGQDFTRVAGSQADDGRKSQPGGADGWFGANRDHPSRKHSSGSKQRKFASAMIAKIPFAVARHIAAVYRP